MSSIPPGSTPAGWYPDANAPGTVRYWDGTAWTEHTYAQTATPPPAGTTTVPGGYQVYRAGMIVGQDVTVGADGRVYFAGRPLCTPWQRFGAALLDGLLMIVTLFIGWIIWACFTAQEGQTPAKRILNQRVLRFNEGTPATFGWMLGMRGFVAGIAVNLLWQCVIPGLVISFMPFWDDKNQTITDKISSCVVVSEA